jgi:hypothetical protein
MEHTPHLLEGEQYLIMEGLNNGDMKKFQHHNILLLNIHQVILQDIVQTIPPTIPQTIPHQVKKVLNNPLVVVPL